jgi:O-antigen/teichoic acid export membrane protein
VSRLLKKVYHNDYLFSVVSKGTGVFFGILFSVFFNRYLGTALRGEAAVISNYVSLVSVMLGIGMHQAYPYFRKREGDIYNRFIGSMTVLFVFYLAVGTLIATLTQIPTNMKVAAVLIPLAVFIKQLNYVVLIEHPRRRHLVAIFLNLIDIAIIAIMMLTTQAEYVYLVIFLFAKEVVYLIIAFQNLHLSVFKIRFEVKDLMKYMRYGILPMFTLMLMTINYRVDILMLQSHVSISQIGIYSLGVSLADKVWLIPDALKDILVSRLSKGKKEAEVASVIRYSLFVGLLVMALMVAVGRPLIIFLYGWDFRDAYLITVIMLAGVIAMIFYKMTYAYNVVNGHRGVNFTYLGIAAVTNVIGNFLLIPYYGIYAAASVSVVSYTICGFFFLRYFHRKSGIPYREILVVSVTDLKGIVRKIRKTVSKNKEVLE